MSQDIAVITITNHFLAGRQEFFAFSLIPDQIWSYRSSLVGGTQGCGTLLSVFITNIYIYIYVGWYSIVGILTPGARFSSPVHNGPRVRPASCTLGRDSLSWG
jgi:hypothetical protein